MQLAYLGLGANLDDPLQQLICARRLLAQAPAVSDLQCSRFYLSSPVGYEQQGDFINCVLRIRYAATAQTLLATLQEIESKLGRVRDQDNQNAPRRIDMDLIWFDNQSIDEPSLQVPHPRWQERLFVILPLLEVAHSELKKTVQTALEIGNFANQEIKALAIPAVTRES